MPHSNPEIRRQYYREWKAKNAQKMRDYTHRYQQENRERINALHREWKKRNPERVRELSAQDYVKHKIKRQAKHKEYAANNPEGRRERYARYVSSGKRQAWKEKNKLKIREYRKRNYEKYRDQYREFQNDLDTRSPRRLAILRKYDLCGELCYICGLHLDLDDMQIDHVHPLSKNGGNNIENLMPSHKTCNLKKGKKRNYPIARPDLIEFAKRIQAIPRAKRKTMTPEYV